MPPRAVWTRAGAAQAQHLHTHAHTNIHGRICYALVRRQRREAPGWQADRDVQVALGASGARAPSCERGSCAAGPPGILDTRLVSPVARCGATGRLQRERAVPLAGARESGRRWHGWGESGARDAPLSGRALAPRDPRACTHTWAPSRDREACAAGLPGIRLVSPAPGGGPSPACVCTARALHWHAHTNIYAHRQACLGALARLRAEMCRPCLVHHARRMPVECRGGRAFQCRAAGTLAAAAVARSRSTCLIPPWRCTKLTGGDGGPCASALHKGPRRHRGYTDPS